MHSDLNLQSHLRTLEESHLRPEVRSSPEALGALLAEDFFEFGSSGQVWDRQTILEDVPSEAPSGGPSRTSLCGSSLPV